MASATSSAQPGEPPDAGDAGDASDASPPSEEAWQVAAPLFSQTSIAAVELQLTSEAITSLQLDPHSYVHGGLRVTLGDGTVTSLSNVGVRLKGKAGSARSIDQKAAFLLKMNEFVKGQKLLGLSKLALNNLVQDSSMLREQLAYELFRAMDVPAPRSGYARVSLNGNLKGLYATIEVVDNEEFLEHWFGSDDGNLYEGEYGMDLEAELVDTFDQDRGPDVAFADLHELADALDQMTTPSTFPADVAAWIDLDAYTRFAATELFLAHWDGYAATRNNYSIYRAPGGLWRWIPWGTDQTLADTTYPVWRGEARVQRMCYASLACRQQLASHYEQLTALVPQIGLAQRVDALEALISDAAAEDPSKEYDIYAVHDAIAQVREFIRDRASFVTSELICTDPSAVDVDADGASGCTDDCNDANALVRPGTTESCNLVDDDCNDAIDDAPQCPRCTMQTDNGGAHYAFCFDRVDYWTAQAECAGRGGTLLSIHSEPQQAWVSQTTSSLGLGGDWWIGLGDWTYEGTFAWDDGTPLDYANWGYGEPNDAGGNEDCAQLSGGYAWNDLGCDAALYYICNVP